MVMLSVSVKRCRDCGRAARSFVRRKTGRRCWRLLCRRCQRRREQAPRRSLVATLIMAAKDRPCVDCGGTFPAAVMDLDHLPKYQKRFALSRALSKPRSAALVRADLAKCEAVCANCHRMRTEARRQVTDGPLPVVTVGPRQMSFGDNRSMW